MIAYSIFKIKGGLHYLVDMQGKYNAPAMYYDTTLKLWCNSRMITAEYVVMNPRLFTRVARNVVFKASLCSQ